MKIKIQGEKQKKSNYLKCDGASESFLKTIDMYQAYKNLKNIFKASLFDIINTQNASMSVTRNVIRDFKERGNAIKSHDSQWKNMEVVIYKVNVFVMRCSVNLDLEHTHSRHDGELPRTHQPLPMSQECTLDPSVLSTILYIKHFSGIQK